MPSSSWVFVIPVIVGAVAVYLLLPRPRAYPVLWGALLGVVALGLAGWLVVGFGALTPESFLFYVFSAAAVGFGALLVTQRNPARAALAFALVVLSTCGLFLLLAAPFLMAATIIIYAGAIIVTFLFVLMLAQQEGPSDADARSREPMLASAIGFILLGALLYVLMLADDSRVAGPAAANLDTLLQRTRDAEAKNDPDAIRALVGKFGDDGAGGKVYQRAEIFQDYKSVLASLHAEDLRDFVETEIQNKGDAFRDADLGAMKKTLAALEKVGMEARAGLHGRLRPNADAALSAYSGPPSNQPPGETRIEPGGRPPLPADNPGYLGKSLFTDYLLPVELGGFLLLAAAIGAIAIAHRRFTPGGAVIPEIPLHHYLAVGAILFCLGMVGFLARRNLIVMFLCAEMMLQGVAINLVAFARYRGNLEGQAFTLFVITVAACEAAIALALILMVFRRKRSLDVSLWQELREPRQEAIVDEEPLPPEERPAPEPVLTPAGLEPEHLEEKSHV